jgi:hypothetical protein
MTDIPRRFVNRIADGLPRDWPPGDQDVGTRFGGGGDGSLNPLYQIGGTRSIQLALKLQF